jgi:integrase
MIDWQTWVYTNFRSKQTITTYKAALKTFFSLYGNIKTPEDLEQAIIDFIDVLSTEGKSSMTIHTYVTAVISYFKDHGIEIPEDKWRRIRRRIKPPAKPSTFDTAGTHDEWKRILTHMSLAGRSLFLFLLSTGCRIGEALQLKISDLDLEKDPPRAYIRPEYTKGGYGGRVVFMTYEARDAIVEYLHTKFLVNKRLPKKLYVPKLRKHIKMPKMQNSDRIWNFGYHMAYEMLTEALRRSGLNNRDEKTGRRLIHIHSTRKFFRSNCGLPDALTHALMGHTGYLDRSYLRQNINRAAEEYKAIAIPRLTIFERTTTDKVEILKLIAKALGVSEERLDTALRDALSFEDSVLRIRELIQESLRSNKQYAIIEEKDVQFYLLHGWDIAKVLNDGRFLMVRI